MPPSSCPQIPRSATAEGGEFRPLVPKSIVHQSSLQTKGCATIMTTMVENEESSGQRPDKPSIEIDAGFGSVAARFDKVEADMREGFARVDQSINGLRGEMNQL